MAPCSCHARHLQGMLTHVSAQGDPHSQRGLWASTQGEMGDFQVLFHVNLRLVHLSQECVMSLQLFLKYTF